MYIYVYICIYVYILVLSRDLAAAGAASTAKRRGKRRTFHFVAALPSTRLSNIQINCYLASSLALACPLGLLPWLLPARTSRYLSPMSPPRSSCCQGRC